MAGEAPRARMAQAATEGRPAAMSIPVMLFFVFSFCEKLKVEREREREREREEGRGVGRNVEEEGW